MKMNETKSPVNLWNSTLCEMIDQCEEVGMQLGDKGKDAEALAGMNLAAQVIKLQADRDALLKALDAAASSLETIERQAGRDEYLKYTDQVRGYAHSRAIVTRESLAQAEKEG
jgi:hypothetical protein